MKRAVAILAAIVLAITCAVGVFAADNATNGSGQLTPIFDDFDPAAVQEMIAGLDFSGLLNDLGMGDISGLLGQLDLGNLLGSFDLGSMLGGLDLGSMLGNLNLESLLGGLLGGKDTPAAPTTTTTTTAAPSTTSSPAAPTTAPSTNIPKTGDAGIGVFVALSVAAGAAIIFTRKREAV